METKRKRRMKQAREALRRIDQELNELEMVDPYGDIIENFQDHEGERHTTRIIRMISEDLRKAAEKRTTLIDTICTCNEEKDGAYAGVGECTCGLNRRHIHCTNCGGITQIG